MKWEWIFLASSVPLWFLAVVFGGLLEKRFPTVVETKGNQIEVLEILRGLAAFVVFCAHVTMWFGGLAPGSRASSYMGDLGVIIFFMLTGFLFWGQIVNGRFKLEKFFSKRIRRLVPLCLFMVGVVTLADWVGAGFPWPTLGNLQAAFRNFGFGFTAVQDVFSPEMYQRINTTWSLRWEWLFYFSLPLFAIVPRYAMMTAWTWMIFALFYNVKDLWLVQETEGCFVLAFYLGALGNLVAPGGWLYLRSGKTLRIAAALLLGVSFVGLSLFAYFTVGAPEARVRHSTFVLIACQLFLAFPLLSDVRVLTSGWFGRAAMHLGRISYSLYLWQLAVIYYVIRGVLKDTNLQTPLGFFGVATVLTLILVAVSHFSFRHIELPFIEGRSLFDRKRALPVSQ